MCEDIRGCERYLCNNPEINVDDYLPISNDDKRWMELDALCFDYFFDNVLCFPFIRHDKINGSWFVDLYVYRCFFDNKIRRDRFIITPGKQMRKNDELRFTNIFRNYHNVYFKLCTEKFIEEIRNIAPELNLRNNKNISESILHIYYASFKSGTLERLFKAQLPYIALNLYEVSEYNLIASNLEDVFGLKLGILRLINKQKASLEIISTPEKRKKLNRVYKQFHGLISGLDELTEVQVEYLSDCLESGDIPDKKFLLTLKEVEHGYNSEINEFIDGIETYKELVEYRKLCDELEVSDLKSIFPKYPNLDDEDSIERIRFSYLLLKDYVKNKAVYKSSLSCKAEKCKRYIFENKKYKIVIPETIRDLLKESQNQHNCLYRYVKDYVFGETIIVFMREKKNCENSLITIEIRNNFICQTKGILNRNPLKDEKEFISLFAHDKGLEYEEAKWQ